MPTIPPPRHDHETLHFPGDFLWGAATSAHQVEGNNTNSDWWYWEQTHLPENMRSGSATDQYHLFEQDFTLLQKLGHNAHRLSIEWSRIEPEEGRFSQEAIDHYLQVLRSLKNKEIKVMLTLHHFTSPVWFTNKGGWESFAAPDRFEHFVQKIVPILAPYVDLWVTINEPGVLVWGGYIAAKWPPQHKDWLKATKATWNLSQAHKKSYRAIHKLLPSAQVGIAHNVTSFNPFHRHSIREEAATWFLDLMVNHFFYKLTGKSTHDFLGLNYYFHQYISFNGEARFPKIVDIATTKKDTSDLGWEINPSGIFDMIMDFSDYHLPIYITENGLASTNDDRRVRFLISYLQEIYHAIASGAQVKGYFHWSLLDNFEWSDGFNPRFGLVEVNYEKLYQEMAERKSHDIKEYKTTSRKARPSALVYKEIISQGGIPHRLLKLLGHSLDVQEELKKDYPEVFKDLP